MSSRFARAAALLAAAVLVAGCSGSEVARLNHPTVPARDSWEVEHTAKADEAERRLEASGEFVADGAMQSYLDGMLRRLLEAAGATATPMRIRVLRTPMMNAGVLVNGLVVIDVGYLSLLDNGAQLAVILGHEVEHFLGRDALRSERDLKRRRSIGIVAMVPLLAIGAADLGFILADGVTGSLGATYSQNQEREADAAGLAAARRAGYDVRESTAPLEAVLAMYAEEGIQDLPKGTHPPMKERLATRRQQLALLEAEKISFDALTKDEGYDAAVAPALVVAAEKFLELHRLARARRAIDRVLSVRSNDARAWFVKGNVLKRTAGARAPELAAVADAYARACELDPGMADAWRELAFVRRIQDRDGDARAAFRRYLVLAPAAPDRAVVEGWLAE
jgi:predicted Zn-dependent protease